MAKIITENSFRMEPRKFIIVRSLNGMFLPSSNPFVHKDYTRAAQEALRLSTTNLSAQFEILGAVGSVGPFTFQYKELLEYLTVRKDPTDI